MAEERCASVFGRRTWPGGDLPYATAEHTLTPWDGRPLPPPIHEVWARRSDDEDAPWTFEVLLNEHRGDRWVSRRDHAISRRLDDVGGRRNGIPFLRPEVVLLYKAKRPTATDEIDFRTVAPRLSESARSRLHGALMTSEPQHPWLERLAARPR